MREENPKKNCASCGPFVANPSGGTTILLVAAGAGLLWLLWAVGEPKKKEEPKVVTILPPAILPRPRANVAVRPVPVVVATNLNGVNYSPSFILGAF